MVWLAGGRTVGCDFVDEEWLCDDWLCYDRDDW